jgi:DNA-binding NarL/FixJ family response regulator
LPIRILVVDDHELVRRQICEILTKEPDLEVVCEASAGFEAVRKAEEYQPDVVVLDIALPELNGLQAAPLIAKVAPEAKILVLTQHDHPFFKRQAMAAGARGFLTKDKAGTELLHAVRNVFSTGPFERAI